MTTAQLVAAPGLVSFIEPLPAGEGDAAPASAGTAGRLGRDNLARRLVLRIAAGAVLLLLIGAALFWTAGGRWFVVQTPSMGTAAPVGSLVLTRPVAFTDLAVGDVIAFHPPTSPGETFTHRIVQIAAGQAHTRGDINGANDPWVLSAHDVIGRAVVLAPGVGWLIRALPLLLIGGIVVWGVVRIWVPRAWQGPARMVGGSLIYLLASVTMRPWVAVVQLAASPDTDGSTNIAAVSTGLLPIRLVPAHSGSAAAVDLADGQVGVVHLTNPPSDGAFALNAHLHLSLLGWLLIGAFCATPLIWTLLVGFRPVEQRAGNRRAA